MLPEVIKKEFSGYSYRVVHPTSALWTPAPRPRAVKTSMSRPHSVSGVCRMPSIREERCAEGAVALLLNTFL
eukprot:12853191-Heterocapsa_arctica.AAC.1